MSSLPDATRLSAHWIAAVSFIGVLACAVPAVAMAADLRIVAPNAVKEVVSDAAARYERASGNATVITWSGSEGVTKRVSDGESFDVVLNTPANLDLLVKAGKIVPGSQVNFAKSGVGVAVRAGQPRPDLSSEDALRKTLLDAPSIGISSGPSGRYLAELFQRLGVADQIRGKLNQPPSGAQIADLLARGEVALGFQQISELQHASGIDYVGPLPASVQNYTIWSAGVHSAAMNAAAARAFLNSLTSAESAAVMRRTGLEPM